MTFGQDPAPQTANEWVRANVRELMAVRRWTQSDLAERLGVSQPWLSKRLTGTTPFQIEDLDALAQVFGLSPHTLLYSGFGKWDRRSGDERRTGEDRRHPQREIGHPTDPFFQRDSPNRNTKTSCVLALLGVKWALSAIWMLA